MKTFTLAAAAASFALFAAPAFAQEAPTPKVKIVQVLGAGSGCPVDENGEPADWSATIDNEKSLLNVEFSSFLVNGDFKTASCHLRVWVAVPQGYKAFAYVSEFGGYAETTAEDYGIFAATMSVGDKEYPPLTHTIPSNTEDDWTSGKTKSAIKAEIPCGGDLVKIDYRLGLSLFGDSSEIQLASHGGSFDDIKFEVKKCN